LGNYSSTSKVAHILQTDEEKLQKHYKKKKWNSGLFRSFFEECAHDLVDVKGWDAL